MPSLQQFIHLFEVGGGMRYARIGLIALALALLAVSYDYRAYRNLASEEAMDTAQLARNIAEGKGYSTLYVRPFSIYLLKRANPNAVDASGAPDAGRLRTPHPDIANPPLYPLLLAGLMKVLPFHYPVDNTSPFWSEGGRFYRYEPDFFIAVLNQLLFLVILSLTFLLAKRLFDPAIAWVSALLLLGTEIFWRFSVSGLSTMLLLLIFTALAWVLTLLEAETREPKWGQIGVFILPALAGILVGLGGLTRYAFAWLILPVLFFLALVTGRQRIVLCLIAFVTFALVLTPWVVRNFHVSGTPFGTATYTLYEDTSLFPENNLQRSINPDLSQFVIGAFWQKLIGSLRQFVQNDLLRLGGSWISAFFLVGFLVGFRNPGIRRLRYFVLSCLILLIVIQALGRTQLSKDVPELNSENLLVLLAPLVLVYGVSFFFVLLDELRLPFHQLRYVIIGGFSVLTCLPMILALLPPKTNPIAYPPYLPPLIQTIASWVADNELTMSDVPAGVAWYGNRQSVLLTLNAQTDFFAINDYQKPIVGLYLTRRTLDQPFFSRWMVGDEKTWGSLCLIYFNTGEPAAAFPLHKAAPWGKDLGQVFFADWERWRKGSR